MSNTFYKPGDWNAHCDVCSFKYKAAQLRKRWDGLMVCKHDYEPDHPQKYLRVSERSPSVPWVRHQNDNPNETGHVCYIYAISGYAELAEADCAKADNTTQSYAFLNNLKNTT
jgi:hypothetical protein